MDGFGHIIFFCLAFIELIIKQRRRLRRRCLCDLFVSNINKISISKLENTKYHICAYNEKLFGHNH